MDEKTKADIKLLLMGAIEKKLDTHESETEYKPFFQAIFNKSQIATASIIQSFYTSFGMSIYEQMAVAIARSHGFEAERQYVLLGQIDRGTEGLIQKIHASLRKGAIADPKAELAAIRKSIKPGTARKDSDSIVDVYLKSRDGNEYFFGITTVKPNKEGFETHKRKLLRWIGLRLSQNNGAKVNVATVLPYNPYHPEKYTRFGSSTLFGRGQFLVQEEFWDFLGGKGTFAELIDVCREVGDELREKIDAI